MYNLLVLDNNSWNHISVPTNDFYEIVRVTWKHVTVYKLLALISPWCQAEWMATKG